MISQYMISQFGSNNCSEYFLTIEVPPVGHSFLKIVDSIFNNFDNVCNEKKIGH